MSIFYKVIQIGLLNTPGFATSGYGRQRNGIAEFYFSQKHD
jgi:hypothetical protein